MAHPGTVRHTGPARRDCRFVTWAHCHRKECGCPQGIGLGRNHHEVYASARRLVYSMRHGGLRGRPYNLGESRRTVEQRDLRRLHGGRRSCGRSRQSTKKLNTFVSIVFDVCAHDDNGTHSRLLCEAITRRHGQVALVSIRIVVELIAV